MAGSALGYLGGGFSLGVQDLRFGFSFSRTGSFAGWFGALVIDLGFATGGITRCEPLHVALQLIRFGAFLCHAYSLTQNLLPMRGRGSIARNWCSPAVSICNLCCATFRTGDRTPPSPGLVILRHSASLLRELPRVGFSIAAAGWR